MPSIAIGRFTPGDVAKPLLLKLWITATAGHCMSFGQRAEPEAKA
jgi:hypothetical protein